MKNALHIIAFLLASFLPATAQNNMSLWVSEAEDANTRVSNSADNVIDIISPKGMTLWYKSLMQGNVVIEYDARIVVEEGSKQEWNRLSDLNCFWMATDPSAKGGNVLSGISKRKGVFVNQYALQLYYLGYGGNHNSTTRFRRYNADARGIENAAARPAILREYTDPQHLLKPNHWYHIRLEQTDGHVRYYIDGECLVDYVDFHPLTKGYFGFRTTKAHAQLRNFKFTNSNPDASPIALRWVGGETNSHPAPKTVGIPFSRGQLQPSDNLLLSTNSGKDISHDEWNLAYWDDGSVKWKALSAVIPASTDSCLVSIGGKKQKGKAKPTTNATETAEYICMKAGTSVVYIPKSGNNLIDSIVSNGKRMSGSLWIEANGCRSGINKVTLERNGSEHSVAKIDGNGFTLRLYAFSGSNQIKMVHTLLVDSIMNAKGLSSLSINAAVPLRDDNHKRYVAFSKGKGAYHYFSVKPLVARRDIHVDENGMPADALSEKMVSSIASWDGFRLSQTTSGAFSLRKRATEDSPWIGTMEGARSDGDMIIGDTNGCLSISMKDFWQSYPSTMQVDGARSGEAVASMYLWSKEAEKMSFQHYDTIPHTLDAAYEDIQEGMSTAYGIARTTTLFINTSSQNFCNVTSGLTAQQTDSAFCALAPLNTPLLPTPEYLHRKRAFGFWSLHRNTETDATIDKVIAHFDNEVERHHWYGFFNYGDFMHSYDRSRDEWRYDVGGYAWDNTELATNAMLWYAFLRKGDLRTWEMAEAMTRHTAEVDCYHFGPNARLGSRHNVLHWGCGAKEARISQAFWNRFLYYLTADERVGDLMEEVKDADQMLYTIDPMRLAQPRSQYPCTAPARLRIGPDWVAYAGNWFTEWERTQNTSYKEKILTGMKSISSMPNGLFTGPKALGYDPATGIISWEGDPDMQNTNHLLTIMGGFEMMNEMMLSLSTPEWENAWFRHACDYKEKALQISRNKFRIPRLQAYGYWHSGKSQYFHSAWDDVNTHTPFSNPSHFFTNDAATWTLDAIFMQEVANEQLR